METALAEIAHLVGAIYGKSRGVHRHTNKCRDFAALASSIETSIKRSPFLDAERENTTILVHLQSMVHCLQQALKVVAECASLTPFFTGAASKLPELSREYKQLAEIISAELATSNSRRARPQ